jgi:hypothetical protein
MGRAVVIGAAAAALAAGLAAAAIVGARNGDGAPDAPPRPPGAGMQIKVVTPPPAKAPKAPKLETLPEGTDLTPAPAYSPPPVAEEPSAPQEEEAFGGWTEPPDGRYAERDDGFVEDLPPEPPARWDRPYRERGPRYYDRYDDDVGPPPPPPAWMR